MVFTSVTSQVTALPLCRGTRERPSGRFPSVLVKPVFLHTGMSITRSLRKWCSGGSVFAHKRMISSGVNQGTARTSVWFTQVQTQSGANCNLNSLIAQQQSACLNRQSKSPLWDNLAARNRAPSRQSVIEESNAATFDLITGPSKMHG